MTRIAQEFGAPLSVIEVATRKLLADVHATADVRERYAKIQRAHLALASMTDNFLNDEVLSHGDFIARKQPLDVAILVQNVMRELELLLDQHSCLLLFRTAPPLLHADRDLLRIALINLLVNAVKYSPPGSRLMLRVGSRGGQTTIAVRDRGAGIEPSALPHIFDRYFRVPGTRGRGVGLGLFLVWRICELHGGAVRAYSARGVGTTVVLCIPAARISIGALDKR